MGLNAKLATWRAHPVTGAVLARLGSYVRLTRIDRPIGTYLLLWPALWALWLAAEGVPDYYVLFVFVLGTFLTRGAGCAINDFADRNVDAHVERTTGRPLATGEIRPREALMVAAVMLAVAFALVLTLNRLTVILSFGGVVLAVIYPFSKRFTHLPQVFLGVAFSWAVPMAFAAQIGSVPPLAWLVFTVNVLWTVAYDTIYAMADKPDDLRIGVKSTAILFGEHDRTMTAAIQVLTALGFVLLGLRFELGTAYYIGVAVAVALFVYEQFLMFDRVRAHCFRAFLNNAWVGLAIFAGIVASYALGAG